MRLIGYNWPISESFFSVYPRGRVGPIHLLDPKISSFYDLKCGYKTGSPISPGRIVSSRVQTSAPIYKGCQRLCEIEKPVQNASIAAT